MGPLRLFRVVATAEAVTWAGLLLGMFAKYGPPENEIGVKIFGPLHGVVFVAYVVTTVVVWIDRRWTPGRAALALVAAVPPFATLLLEWWALKKDWLSDTWRLRAEDASSVPERAVSWVVRNPLRGLAAALGVVAVLTVLALLVGPPASA